MINIIKQEIPIDESLKKKLEFICDFCNTTPTFINGSIRKIDKSNLVYVEPHKVIINNIMFLVFNYSNDVYIKNFGNKIIALTSNKNSTLAHHADYVLDITVEREVGDDECRIAQLDGAAVQLAVLVLKNAQVGAFFGQLGHNGAVVGIAHAQQDDKARPDGPGLAPVNGNACAGDALDDCSHRKISLFVYSCKTRG